MSQTLQYIAGMRTVKRTNNGRQPTDQDTLMTELPETETKTTRMQVHGTAEEAAELDQAAKAAGFSHHSGGRSAFMLRASLASARAGSGALSVTGKVAAQVIADAAAEGISVEDWLSRALMLTRTARGPVAAPSLPPRARRQ